MNCMCPADIRWDACRIYADSSSLMTKPKTESADIMMWFELVRQYSCAFVFSSGGDVDVGFLPFCDH